MKKAILLLVLTITFFGCDNFSDNESNAVATDPILGTWQLASKTVNGTPEFLEACEKQTIYTFTAEGAKFSGEDHNFATQNCEVTTLEGRWGRDADHYYIIYNNNTTSITWSDVMISETSMTTVVISGDNNATYTWKR